MTAAASVAARGRSSCSPPAPHDATASQSPETSDARPDQVLADAHISTSPPSNRKPARSITVCGPIQVAPPRPSPARSSIAAHLGRRAQWRGPPAHHRAPPPGSPPRPPRSRRRPARPRDVSRAARDPVTASRASIRGHPQRDRRRFEERFRVVHFSVQGDHVHTIVEASDTTALSRGISGLLIRAARALNRALRRRGRVWSGRFHARALATPRETRTAIVYVLQNWKRHIRRVGGIDARSSGPWFDGWSRPPERPSAPCPVAGPRTWLAAVGWRLRGG